MRKWIRWPGLVSFLVLVAAAVLFWMLAADWLAERSIERLGTRMLGAEVELAAVDLDLFPPGFGLQGLEIADPDEPRRNAVAIKRIRGALEFEPLVRRKVVVATAAIDGIEFATPRKTSVERGPGPAKTPGAETPAAEKAGRKWPRLPTVEEILAREKLESVEQARRLQDDLKTAQDKWQRRLQELPGQQRVAELRRRVEQLRQQIQGRGNILGAAQSLQSLRGEIEADISRLKQARGEFNREMQEFRRRLEAVLAAPQADAARLQAKYAPSLEGMGNVAGLLLGEQAGTWVAKAVDWYRRLQPLLERRAEKRGQAEVVQPLRGKGADVRFAEYEPLPDFLLRKAQLSLPLAGGVLRGEVHNVTAEQEILGRPLTFNLAGRDLGRAAAIEIEGTMDRVAPAAPRDQVQAKIRGLKVRDLNLAGAAVGLAEAVVDLDLQAQIQGENLTAEVAANINGARPLAPQADRGDFLGRALARALADNDSFEVRARVGGTLEHYRVEVSTSLDQAWRRVLGREVARYRAGLEEKLRRGVAAKAEGDLQGCRQALAGFSGLGGDLDGRMQQLTRLQQNMPRTGGAASPGGIKLPF